MKKGLDRVQLLVQAKKIHKKVQPIIVRPMLATLTDHYFYTDAWIYERKLDGERCLAFKTNNAVALKSRNNKCISQNYPEIMGAIQHLRDIHSAIFDGEIIAVKGSTTNFSLLQSRMQSIGTQDPYVKIYYYIFDILYLNGYDLTDLPLIDRKRLLKDIIEYKAPLRYCTYTVSSSDAKFAHACKQGWEGFIVKKADSLYEHNRSSSWLKFKCTAEQEFVIGGFTDPRGSRVGFGSLLLGYYKKGKLYYAGKVGTGFDTQTLLFLRKKFSHIIKTACPFVNYNASLAGVHWLRPTIVCEVGFTQWTNDNKLRHPRYLGLRRDKSAKKVVQEIE